MHLICFVEPADVERAQSILDEVQWGATKGAKAVPGYSSPVVRTLVPKLFRIGIDRLEEAEIKNFALMSTGGEQVLEALNG